jgi:hypothetical protein
MKCYICGTQAFGTYYRRGKNHLICSLCINGFDNCIELLLKSRHIHYHCGYMCSHEIKGEKQ